MLEDFGESQEDIFHRITEINSTQQRVEPIVVPNRDSAEQDEPQPNSNKPSNVTTTLVNETTNMEQGDHRTQTNEPTPDPMTRDPNSPPTEPTIVTQREEDNAGTLTPTTYGEEGNTETHKSQIFWTFSMTSEAGVRRAMALSHRRARCCLQEL
mgnify:CR=1 FL=1